MKTADRILLYFAIAVFALIAVTVIVIRINTSPGKKINIETIDSGKIVSRDFDFTNFNEIGISGAWKVNIKKGDGYRVMIKMPAGSFNNLETTQEGGKLIVGFNDYNLFRQSENRIEITLPRLSRFESSGSSDGTISNFEAGALDLHFSGSSRMQGTGNSIGNLNITASGSTFVDMKESSITNAHVDLSGSSSIALNMAGGDLGGDVSGSSSIVYKGSLRSQSISQSGSSTVKYQP